MCTARRQFSASAPVRGVAAPPPLENGDRLTATEFLRRYEAMPEVKKAELINGIVHIASPVRAQQHGIPDSLIQTWLGTYSVHTPRIVVSANSTVRFDGDNVPQPDVVHLKRQGGRARIGKDGYIHGPPDLIVEVAASSAALDLNDKLEAYRRAGVQEYVVWRPTEQALDWFVLEEDDFIPLKPDARGVIGSRCFPGLVLDVAALLRQDLAAVLSRLSKGLGKGPHKSFVTSLKRQ